MTFDAAQRRVIVRIAVCWAISLAVLAWALIWPPIWLVPTVETGSRLRLAGLAALLPLLCLLVAIGRVGMHRFRTPSDRDGSGLTDGTPRARLLRAFVQNTLEQAVLAAGIYAVCAVTLPSRWLGVLPAAAMLFVIGRILFARGYKHGAPGRTAGFALTIQPTVLLILLTVAWVLFDALQPG